jgi:two-component system sensor histidine kinase KdpD
MNLASKIDIAIDTAANSEPYQGNREHLLVVMSSSEYDLDLIHAGRRLAEALRAAWTVVNMQTSAFRLMPDRRQDRRLEIARIAETLGAESVTLHGASAAHTIAGYARLRQASRILVGSPARFGWSALMQHACTAALRRMAPGTEIIAIAARVRSDGCARAGGSTRPALPPLWRRRPYSGARALGYLWGLAFTAISTAAAWPIAGHVDLINIVLIYLLAAAMSGMLLGRGPSALTAIANTLAFDYFFVPPLFSFQVLDSSYCETFAAMLLVALIIANLMSRPWCGTLVKTCRHMRRCCYATRPDRSARFRLSPEPAASWHRMISCLTCTAVSRLAG